jgi:peptide/nickel transport system substrate-binding protein
MHDEETVTESSFDQRMNRFLKDVQQRAINRRRFIGMAAGSAAAAMAGPLVFPGVSVLAQDATTVTFGLESDIRGVEPALAYDFTANPVVCNITEGLMMLDGKGAVQPLLAAKYDHPDALTYIYTLRTDVKFHDGTPLTVDDVLASIGRVRAEAIASPMAWMYDPTESIEKTGDNQITIKLKTASGTFQFVVATTAGHVMPKKLIDASPDQPIVEPVGTGPYKFVKWDAGSEIDLEKNTSYWQAGKPYFEKAVFKIVPDATARVTGLKTGELTAFREIPPDQLDTVKALPDVTVQDVVGYTINMIAMVNDKAPFNDPKIREAVSKAIDYTPIMTNLVKDTGVQAHASNVPSTMPHSAEDVLQPVAYDVAAAKAALAASTQPTGFKTTLTVDSESSLRVAEAQAIQQMLAAIGVDAQINKIPQADRITLLQSGDYEGMIFHEWGADFPDANAMLLPLFHSRNFPPQNNQSKYSNPAVDKLLDDADAETDDAKRGQMLVDAQKLIAADMPVIWLDHPKWFLAMKSNLTGLTINPLFYWDCWLRDLKPA